LTLVETTTAAAMPIRCSDRSELLIEASALKAGAHWAILCTILGNSVTSLGYSVTSLGYSVTILGYSVTSLGYGVTILGYSVTILGYSVTSLGYSVTILGCSVTSLGYSGHQPGLECAPAAACRFICCRQAKMLLLFMQSYRPFMMKKWRREYSMASHMQ
jgi:hypothetical protein